MKSLFDLVGSTDFFADFICEECCKAAVLTIPENAKLMKKTGDIQVIEDHMCDVCARHGIKVVANSAIGNLRITKELVVNQFETLFLTPNPPVEEVDPVPSEL